MTCRHAWKQRVKRRTMMTRTLMASCALDMLATWPAHAAPNEPGTLTLPSPDRHSAWRLGQALMLRRSVRAYTAQPLPLAAVSQLLWAAQGTTGPQGRRTAPSAGALYPLELRVVAARVEGLEPGVYRYMPAAHQLRPEFREQVLPALSGAAFQQQAVAGAAAVVVIAAVEERTSRKYGARAGRFVAFEAGAASQNLALQAAAQGLGTVVIGAFDDLAVARVLRLTRGERPLALMPVGLPDRAAPAAGSAAT